jgi:hypothetical protein
MSLKFYQPNVIWGSLLSNSAVLNFNLESTRGIACLKTLVLRSTPGVHRLFWIADHSKYFSAPRSTKYWFWWGLADHLSSFRGPPVVHGADVVNLTCLFIDDCLFCRLLSCTSPSTAWYRMLSSELSINKSSGCWMTRLMAERRMVELSEVSKITFRPLLLPTAPELTYLGSVCHPFLRSFSRSGKSKLGPAWKIKQWSVWSGAIH